MGITITQAKEHLSAQLHGGTLKRVRNIEALFERVSNTVLTKIDPIDTMRTAGLVNTIHDDVYNYSLPSDYKKIIDLLPQDTRQSLDSARRRMSERFDLRKALTNKTITIEGSEGSKIIRINWRSRQGKVLNAMNNVDDNGTWIADTTIGTTTGIVQDTITKKSGGGSVRFDLSATGDGIQNTSMTKVDMTDEDEVADAFLWFYIKNATDLGNLTSVTLDWGNDLATAYWTGVAQTAQADGRDFQVGWNLIRIPWSTATETGTVDPKTIDSASIIFAIDAAISDIRVDNIVFSIGRNFDIKYYSKFLIQNTSGTFITRTTSDDDVVVLDNDAIQIFLLETLIAAAQQVEGADSTFDINYAKGELEILYRRYKSEYPSMAKKAVSIYGSRPDRGRFNRI